MDSLKLTLLRQVWDVPEAWSLKDAATVPVAYLTAYYALLMRGAMQAGQSVLVHSGTGAVGLAAIRIAHFRGCEVRSRAWHGLPEQLTKSAWLVAFMCSGCNFGQLGDDVSISP